MRAVLALLMLGVTPLTAVAGMVEGQVFMPSGEPAMGVTVLESGSNGTFTDEDGHFRLEVPEGQGQLTVRLTGMWACLVPVQPGTVRVVLKESGFRKARKTPKPKDCTVEWTP